jgi:triosephosphate isomerase
VSPGLPQHVVGVSLKMYLDAGATRAWLARVAAIGAELDPARIALFVLPGFLAIRDARVLLDGSGVGYGGQDVCWADEGAYTGEVSAPMLADEGCRYAEVGHAERRRLFGETDEMTAAKAAAAARSGLVPVVCIGESDSVDVQAAVAQCTPQVLAVLDAVPPGAPMIIAYEPVWAIGATQPAPHRHVVGVVDGLRGVVDRHSPGRGSDIRFLYGGSAGPGTFAALRGSLDGLFLGRFAHDPDNLRAVLDEVLERDPASSPTGGQS